MEARSRFSWTETEQLSANLYHNSQLCVPIVLKMPHRVFDFMLNSSLNCCAARRKLQVKLSEIEINSARIARHHDNLTPFWKVVTNFQFSFWVLNLLHCRIFLSSVEGPKGLLSTNFFSIVGCYYGLMFRHTSKTHPNTHTLSRLSWLSWCFHVSLNESMCKGLHC